MRSEPQLLSVRLPPGIRMPKADGTFTLQSPAGERLIMDCAAKLVQGCTVAVFLGAKFALVGRIVRRPVRSRHLVIECRDVKRRQTHRVDMGLKDKDVQIWRVTGVWTPVPFADEPEEETQGRVIGEGRIAFP